MKLSFFRTCNILLDILIVAFAVAMIMPALNAPPPKVKTELQERLRYLKNFHDLVLKYSLSDGILNHDKANTGKQKYDEKYELDKDNLEALYGKKTVAANQAFLLLKMKQNNQIKYFVTEALPVHKERIIIDQFGNYYILRDLGSKTENFRLHGTAEKSIFKL